MLLERIKVVKKPKPNLKFICLLKPIGMMNSEILQEVMQEDTENLPCELGIRTTFF